MTKRLLRNWELLLINHLKKIRPNMTPHLRELKAWEEVIRPATFAGHGVAQPKYGPLTCPSTSKTEATPNSKWKAWPMPSKESEVTTDTELMLMPDPRPLPPHHPPPPSHPAPRARVEAAALPAQPPSEPKADSINGAKIKLRERRRGFDDATQNLYLRTCKSD